MGSQTVGHDWSDLAGSRQHIVELDYLNKISLICKIKHNNYRKIIKAKLKTLSKIKLCEEDRLNFLKKEQNRLLFATEIKLLVWVWFNQLKDETIKKNWVYQTQKDVGKIPWRRDKLHIPVFFPGEFHGRYSPWGQKESDTTEPLSLSYTSYKPLPLIHSFN